MALYNVFLPGYHGAPINVAKVTGGLTENYPVSGSMFYGVSAASTSAALQLVYGATGANLTEQASAYLQSNDTRVDH